MRTFRRVNSEGDQLPIFHVYESGRVIGVFVFMRGHEDQTNHVLFSQKDLSDAADAAYTTGYEQGEKDASPISNSASPAPSTPL
jgi:hypothetical protein